MLPLIHRLLRRLPPIVACVVAFAPASLRAQDGIEPGAQVRVLAPSAADSLLSGRVVAIDAAWLLLAPPAAGESLQLPTAAIERLEVLRRGRRRTFKGGAIGVLIGAAGGYALTHALVRNSDCEYVCGAAEASGSVAGALAGLGVGAIIGGRYRDPDRWEAVPLPRARE